MMKGSGRFSRPIVNIAILGIILGVAIMLITMAIVRGFRSEVRDKVVAFNSHIHVKDLDHLESSEGHRLLIEEDFLAMDEIQGVEHVQPLVQRSAILETKEGISGVMAKGAGKDFRWDYFSEALVAGELPNCSGDSLRQEILISKSIADKLLIDIGDRVSVYFVKNIEDLSTRRLTVTGFYQTDLEEFDLQFVFLDIRHVQKVNGWGLQAQLAIGDTCDERGISVEARAFDGKGRHFFHWNKNWRGAGPHFICPDELDQIWVAVSDDVNTVQDTAFASIRNTSDECDCDGLTYQTSNSGGSQRYYTGGYEVFVTDFEDLLSVEKKVRNQVSPMLATNNIIRQTPEIFSWLELFDVNVYIIITLMIAVAVINMSSALLILILERSNMIGILKSLGSDDWSIRKIFLRNAAVLILHGLFWGNLIGIGLALIQKHFNLITLPAESYYLNTVPILLDVRDILLIDIGTLVICVIALVVPSWLITRISPVRAIRFD